MKPGDIIQMQSNEIPLPEFSAAVIAVDENNLEILSTLIVPFQHGGKFKRSEIRTMVTCPAEEAVERETGFKLGTVVRTRLRDGSEVICKAFAGFNGILVGVRDDGRFVTGGSSFWFNL